MKHVKLFEAWDQEMSKPEILVGYFSDGGMGSHPGVIDRESYDKIKSHPQGLFFTITEELQEVPEALLTVYYPDKEWDIKGISNELANQIIAVGGTDSYDNQDVNWVSGTATRSQEENEINRRAFELAGKTYKAGEEFTPLIVIQNIELNTVYWSNNPEQSHGYWESPDEVLSVDQLLNRYDEIEKEYPAQ